MKTKTAAGLGMTRKRKDGTWEGRITIGYDESGNRIRKSVYGKTENDVVEKMRLLHGQLVTSTYIEPSKMKLSEWLSIWSSEYLNSVKESTKKAYISIIENRINPNIGGIQLKKLQPHIIQGFYNRLYETGLSPKSLRNTHGVLHKALDTAVKNRYLQNNPAAVCDLPKVEKYNFDFIDKTQVPDFFEAIKGNKYEVFYKVCLFTGMRIAECAGLTWDCIDLRKGTIKIEKQIILKGKHPDRKVSFATPKNGKSRIITPAPFIISMIYGLKRAQLIDKKKNSDIYLNRFNLIFTNPDGSPLSITSIEKNLKKCLKGKDLPALRVHDLRHSYAVLSIQAGDDFKTISENMGHFSVAFTMDTYAKVSDQMKKESADKMQNLFEGLVMIG